MPPWPETLVAALRSSAAASLASAAALAIAARVEGKSAPQPLNATSHWLNGPGAARVERMDLRHTGTGLATHHAANFFWAALFERWIAARGPLAPGRLLARALAFCAFAAAVDYGPTPKRFTPGWELVLGKRAMAAVYAAMAVGLAAGASAGRRAPPRSRRNRAAEGPRPR